MKQTDYGYLLQPNDSLVTENEREAFFIRSGCVNVFITPKKSGENKRRILLCTAREQSIIPSFVFRDQDYQHWCFVLVAERETEVECRAGWVTSALKRNFANRIGLTDVDLEGFENSLVERYKQEIVKDDVFIGRGIQGNETVGKNIVKIAKGVFSKKSFTIQGDNEQYRAVAYASICVGASVREYDEIKRICGENLSVQNIAYSFNLICREVLLFDKWYETDCGTLVVTISDKVAVCTPKKQGYQVFFPSSGKIEKLTKEIAATIQPHAYSLARTLPSKPLSKKDIVHYCKKDIYSGDISLVLLLGLFGTLIGILLPLITQKVYDNYIPLGDYSGLVQMCLVMGAFMIGNIFFSIVKSLCEFRLKSRIGYKLQAAAYHRVFKLPERFFHDYESADLAQRLVTIGPAVNGYISAVLITGVSTIFSCLYLFRMFKYSKKLAWISIVIVILFSALLIPLALAEIKHKRIEDENTAVASSKLYQYLNGIEKIRMAGVENRAMSDYMIPYSNSQTASIKRNRYVSAIAMLQSVSTSLFSMVLYYVFVKSKIEISMGSFVAFNTAFGAFTSAILKYIEELLELYQMKPTFERFMPIFRTGCEDEKDKEILSHLTGDVSIRHLTFSYPGDQKIVLDDIDLNIKPGEYIGIVGSSGCGKSTLIKLLLGFETPTGGNICYDSHELLSMDKQVFRKNLGVVLQNGQLISGSIYENITITAPEATKEMVDYVIDAVGLKEDIAQMPMGLQTLMNDTSNTISGGQRQRMLIARAIIRNPSILVFDEATSALDNVTQAKVSESLDKMNATRIVVAHRLSTIRNCDRIIVMDKGQIVEEGSYDDLMKLGGIFYSLASRQIAE